MPDKVLEPGREVVVADFVACFVSNEFGTRPGVLAEHLAIDFFIE